MSLSLLLAIGSDNLGRGGKKPLHQQMSVRNSSLLSGVALNAGSFFTSLYTIDSISAVTFTISLWRSVTNPPVLHVNIWSMLYSCGKLLSSHRYLNKIASKNSGLVYENLSCFNDKDDNDIEAPSDVAISLAFNCAGIILLRRFLRRLS